MSEQLKPCPFCGGDAEISRYGNSKMSTMYHCNWCGVSLETSEEHNHGERWNDRFETPMQKCAPEMHELLKDLLGNSSFNVEHSDAADKIELMFAKARGES